MESRRGKSGGGSQPPQPLMSPSTASGFQIINPCLQTLDRLPLSPDPARRQPHPCNVYLQVGQPSWKVRPRPPAGAREGG